MLALGLCWAVEPQTSSGEVSPRGEVHGDGDLQVLCPLPKEEGTDRPSKG